MLKLKHIMYTEKIKIGDITYDVVADLNGQVQLEPFNNKKHVMFDIRNISIIPPGTQASMAFSGFEEVDQFRESLGSFMIRLRSVVENNVLVLLDKQKILNLEHGHDGAKITVAGFSENYSKEILEAFRAKK